MIDHVPVKSSMIKSIGHDPEKSELEVKFSSGVVGRYKDISEDDFANFLGADSHGKHFNMFIKGREK